MYESEPVQESIDDKRSSGKGSVDSFEEIKSHENMDSCPCADNSPRILLVTYFRSGSSFLGDLLQHSCHTFYSFEPLHIMTDGERIPDFRSDEAFFLLEKIFECAFPHIPYYVKWALKPDNRFLFRWNHLLWSSCKQHPVSCFNAAFIKRKCQEAQLHVVKSTRLHMTQVRKFLNTLSERTRKSLKVVLLVRDPRGIYNSRKQLIWCHNNSCSDPKTICSEMESDVSEFKSLKAEMPDQFFILRYEDLSLTPEQATSILFQKLQIPYSKHVTRFLRSHTSAEYGLSPGESRNPYSTRRDSVATAFEWANKMTEPEIRSTQSVCNAMIDELRYLRIHHFNDSKRQRISNLLQYVKRNPFPLT